MSEKTILGLHNKIEHRQIRRVVTDTFITKGSNNYIKRPVQILQHEIIEIIEIRYQSDWHFRTCGDNKYFETTAKDLLKNTTLIGYVDPSVSFKNEEELKSIIVNKLYISPEEELNSINNKIDI